MIDLINSVLFRLPFQIGPPYIYYMNYIMSWYYHKYHISIDVKCLLLLKHDSNTYHKHNINQLVVMTHLILDLLKLEFYNNDSDNNS